MEINESIISANFSQGYGGGLKVGYLRAHGCTIAGNESGLSGGGVYLGPSNNLSFFTNCVLWGNSDLSGTGLTAQITSSLPPTVIFSCIQDNDPNDSDIPFGGEPNGNIDDDPMFVTEPNDGGDGWGVGGNDDYGDLHLKLNSPCIEKGNPYYLNVPKSTDIDGQPRVMGKVIDMGADEYAPIIAVTRPKAGEIWATNSKRKIEWTAYGVSSVNILLSEDGGENWEPIVSDLTDANSYLWEVPDFVESSQCVISVVPGDGDVNVITLESGLFTIRWYPLQPSVPPEWKRRGLLPGPDLSENTGPKFGCAKWVFETDGPVTSQVAVTRPYWNSYGVYIGCEDGNIYALDDQGEFFWSFDINTPIVGSPAVGYYDMVYVAGQNGWLYAIDDYGDPRWTFTINGPFYSTPVVGYSGAIYVCSEDGIVYAIDANGSDLWTFSIGQAQNKAAAIFASPLIEKNGSVYIAGLYDANLYALDANTGSVKWVCGFATPVDPCDPNKGKKSGLLFATPAVGPDGTIYQTIVYDTNLYAVDSNNGAILWKTNLADPCVEWYGGDYTTKFPSASGWNTPAVGLDGTIYVCLDDIFLRAVKPDGTIKWVTRLGELGWFTITVAKNGLIYVAGDDGFVCVVDPNGKEVSRFKGDGWVTYPAIVEDGTLIVGDANNRVWAITNTPCDGLQPILHSPADIQPSWMVDLIDFALLADNWLQCTDPANESCSEGISLYGMFAPGDINRDLYVDYWDIADMSDRWLTGAN